MGDSADASRWQLMAVLPTGMRLGSFTYRHAPREKTIKTLPTGMRLSASQQFMQQLMQCSAAVL